jgi:GTP-binding protein HflX
MQLKPTTEYERAILVGVAKPDVRRVRTEEYLDELTLLAESAGAVVVHRITQERRSINAASFIGKGKAEEVAWLVDQHRIGIVIFDDDLSPVQVRNLERIIKCKIIDRSGIILDIFASRARTSEAKVQVELAQLHYLLPRLTRQWTHLSKQFGGIGTKGPGETQIETDRRAIRTRISTLNTKLRRISREREIQRKGREQFPRVALVGYTNAGKSTLLNLFSGAGVLVEDRLFATLDATVRLVTLSPLHTILLSDTVGFIRKLPHHLVASFKSTLEEVTEADMLLHVVDVSHPLFQEQISVVNETLEEIGAQGKPTVMVFNKIDRVQNRAALSAVGSSYENAVVISAARGINVGALQQRIMALLDSTVTELSLILGQRDHKLISHIHDVAEILEIRYEEERIFLRCRMNRRHAERVLALVNGAREPRVRRTSGR